MSGLQTKSYQPGDEAAILNLFRQSYGGRELPLSFWQWRFRDNPAGPGLIELSWDGDVLAAHYAVTSVALRIEGRDWLAGLSGTTMTHPDYRGRGLFPILARSTYARMAAGGMALVWGFPNTQSHRGFARDLNWLDIDEVPMFRLPLEPRPPALNVPSQICQVASADARFDRLWLKTRDDYAILGRRDAAHLNWRYVTNPTEQYQLIAYVEGAEVLGYAVLKRYQTEVQIVDLLIGRQAIEVGEGLVAYAIRQAAATNATAVSLWLNVTQPLHHALEKLGFRPDGPVTYLGGLGLQPELGDHLYDIRRWHVTMGDSDVF